MRIAFFLLSIVALALAGYVAIGGYFLAHSAANTLNVGQLASTQAAEVLPTDPLALGYRGDPLQALALPFQTVALETPLGPAEAWLVPAAGAERGRAIYVHGIGGAREDGYRHLSTLHEAGWSVLLISYRNDASAPVAPEGLHAFGLLEWPDLEAAVAHLAPEDTAPGVLVVADAMGGAILGQFLRQSPLAGRVRAVALDSPALSFQALVAELAARSDMPLSGITASGAGLILPRITGLPLDKAEVAEVFTAYPGPLFLAHGAADRVVPPNPSQAMAEARTASTATLWTGADHLGSFAEDPAAYRTAFTAFLSEIAG